MKLGREVIEVNFEELATLLERARAGPLGEEDCQRLQAAIHALSYLIELIGKCGAPHFPMNVKLPGMWSWRAKPLPIAVSSALNSTFCTV